MTADTDQPAIRYCRACSYPLRAIDSEACPECGRAFDPKDPRTTTAHSAGPVRTAIAGFVRVLIWCLIAITLLSIAYSALYHDPIVALLLGIALSPLLLLQAALVAVPGLPIAPRTRWLAVGVMLVLASVLIFAWPFRVSFRLHQNALERYADRVRSGEVAVPSGPVTIGIMNFRNVRFREGNVGFQLTGGAGGGVHLVQLAPNPVFTWVNTNWEITLDDRWIWVYQD